MSFFTLVLKNLLQRRTRSLLTIAGIATGVGAVVALTSLAWGFEKSWARIYTARGTDLIITKAGSLSPSPPAFAQEQAHDLRTLPHVVDVAGVMSEILSIEDAPIVMVFGWESHTFLWEHLRIVSGRWPIGDAEPAVVIGSVAADGLKKTVGSQIQIETATFTVCGIFASASLIESGAVVMTLPQLQRVTEQPGKVNFLNLKLAPGATAGEEAGVRRSIGSRLPGFKVFTAGEVAQNNTAIQAAKAISWATSAIALVVGAVGVMNTVLMSVFERMHEIGILLAIGWRRSRIVLMIICESIALSLAGGIVGMTAGAAAVTLVEMAPLLRGKVEGDFSVWLFIVAFVVSIALGMLGGAYPAYRGARMRPSEALRYE